MSQKQKLRLKANEKIVKSYLAGEVSIRGAAAENDKEKAGGNRISVAAGFEAAQAMKKEIL